MKTPGSKSWIILLIATMAGTLAIPGMKIRYDVQIKYDSAEDVIDAEENASGSGTERKQKGPDGEETSGLRLWYYG